MKNRIALVLAAAVAAASMGRALAVDWNDTSTDFNLGSSWTGGLPGTGDIANFNSTPTNQPALSAPISILGLTVNGGDITLGGTGPLTLGASGLTVGSGAGLVTLNNDIVLGADQAWTSNINFVLSSVPTINGAISGAHGISITSGSSYISFAGNNTYSGPTVVNGSYLVGRSFNAFGDASATNTLSIGSGGLYLFSDTGTAAYNTTVTSATTIVVGRTTAGAAVTQTLGSLNIGTSLFVRPSQINDPATGAMTGTPGLGFGAVTMTADSLFSLSGTDLHLGSVTGNFNLNLTHTANPTLGNTIGAITTGTGTVTINGGGTWNFTGASTYSGVTSVNSGKLIVSNASGSATGSGAVNLNGGTSLYSGSVGSIGGAVTSNGATVAPGGLAGIGSLGVNSLALNSGSTLNLDLNGALFDSLNVAGVLTVAGSTLTFNSIAAPTASTYTLATYAASGLTNASFGTINNLPSGYSLVVGNTSIQLIASLSWRGTDSLNPTFWDINTTQNFAVGASSALYTDGSPVSFDNTGVGLNVAIQSAVAPSSLTINNDGAHNYVFNGPGHITGATNLLKQGVGSLTINNTGNDFTGGTSIQDGSIILGVANALPIAGNITLTGGTLDLMTFNQSTSGLVSLQGGTIQATGGGILTSSTLAYDIQAGAVSASLAGAVGLNKTTTGVATLSGNNSYSGLTSISAGKLTLSGANSGAGGVTLTAGTLVLGNNNALGTGTFTIAGGTLDASSAFNIATANPIIISGDFAFTGSNSINLGTSAVDLGTAVHAINIAANNLTIGGNMTGSGGGISQTGPGTLTLNGTNTYTGSTNVSAGSLVIGGSISGSAVVLSGSAVLTENVDNAITGVFLTINGASVTLTRPNNYTGGTTLTAGTLVLTNTTGIGTGTLSIGGGTLDATTAGLTLTNPLAFTGNFAFAGTQALNLGTGPVTLTATPTINVTNSLTIGGNIGGGFGITKTGAGTLILSGTSTYTGVTTLTTGTLVAANVQAFGTGTASLSLGTGTVLDLKTDTSINPYNTAVTGNTTIQSDKATAASAGITQTLGTLTIGGNTLTIAAGSNVTGGSPAIAFGAANVTGSATFNTTSAALTLASMNTTGGFTINTTGTAPFSTTVTGTTTLGGNTTFNPTTAIITLGSVSGTNTNVTLGGTDTNSSFIGSIQTGTGTVTKSTAAIWTLTAASTYTGSTTLTGGTLILGADNVLGTVGTITASSGVVIQATAGGHALGNPFFDVGNNTVLITGANTVTINGILEDRQSGTGGVLTVNSTVILAGGIQKAIADGTGNRQMTINGSGTTNITGNVTNGLGTTQITYSGTGTINFTGTSNYASNGGSGFNITTGTLGSGSWIGGTTVLAAAASLSPSGALIMGGGPAGDVVMTVSTRSTSTSTGSITFNPGRNLVNVANFTGTGGLGLGAITRNPGAIVSFGTGINNVLPTGGSITTTTANANFAGGQQTILGGWAINAPGNTVANWIVSGTGATPGALTAAPTYTPVNSDPTLAAAGAKDLNITGSANLPSGTPLTVNSIKATAANTLTLNDALTVATGGILYAPAGASTFNIGGSGTGSITSGNGQDLILLVHDNAADVVNITVPIVGSIGLTVANSSEASTPSVTLSKPNTFTGTTTIIGALTLTLADPLALQNSTVNYDGQGGTLSLGTLTSATLGGLKGSQNLALPATAGLIVNVGNNNADTLYSGVLSGLGGTAAALNKIGTGTLTLTNVETYTSTNTSIQGGTLVLGTQPTVNGRTLVGGLLPTVGALPAATVLTLGTGVSSGKLVLGDATSAAPQTLAGLVTSGTGSSNAVVGGNAANSTLTVNNATTNTFNGSLGGAGVNQNKLALVKNGAGNLILGSANTYTGNTTVNAGSLTLASTASLGATAITVAGTATFAAQPLTGSSIAAGSSLALGAGTTFTLAGDANAGSFNLATTFSAAGAAFKFDLGTNGGGGTVADVLAITGAATLSGSNTIAVTGFGSTNLTLGTYNIITAASGLNTGGTFTLTTPIVNVNGNIYALTLINSAGAEQLQISAPPTWVSLTGGSWGTAANWSTNPVIPGSNVGDAAVFGNATTNNQIVTLNGNRTLGTLLFTNASASGAVGTFTLDGAAGPSTLTLDNGANAPVVGNVTGNNIINAAVALNGTPNITISAGTSLTINGLISGASQGITLNGGTGSLILGTANTYGGTTTIQSGTLQFATNNAIAAAGTIVVSGGALNLGGFSETHTGSLTLTAGAITNGTLTQNSAPIDAQAGTISANIAGSAGLTKSGAGTVILSGAASNYSGNTTINAGTLSGQSLAAFGTSTVVLNGGLLDLSTDTSINANGVNVNINSTIQVNRLTSGAGITDNLGQLTIGAFTLNTVSGPQVTSGTAKVAFSSTVLTGNAVFNPTTAAIGLNGVSGIGNLTLQGSNTSNTVGAITTTGGTVGVVTGIWTFSGASNYTAATTVTGGTLNQTGTFGNTAIALSAGTLSLQGASAVSQNTLTVSGTGTLNETVANALGGTAALTISAGTANLSVANNNSGTTTVTGGTVNASAAGALSASAVTVTGGTVNLSATNAVSGGSFSYSAGAINLSAAGAITNTSVTFTGNSTTNTFSETVANAISGTSTVTVNSSGGNGVMTFSQANNYSGDTTITSGKLVLAAANAVQSTNLNVNGGILNLTAAGAVNVGTLNFNSLNFNQLSQTVDNAISGATAVVVNSVASGVIIDHANNYTGGTTLISGFLSAANTSGSATGSGPITISGSSTLASGTVGTIAGAVTVTASGPVTITPGVASSAANNGILNLTSASGLTINGNTTLEFGINGTLKDVLSLTGPLTISSGTPNLNFLTAGTFVGDYTLATYAPSSLTNASFNVTGLPAGYFLQVTSSSIKLAADNPEWLGGTSSSPGVSDWDTTTAGNWRTAIGLSSVLYSEGNSAYFNDNVGAGNTTVNITGTRTPFAVVVSANTHDYIFTGPGKISGSAVLLKQGLGTLTINNTGNDYSGGTFIQAGKIVVGVANALPAAGQINVQGGTLQYNLADAQTTAPITITSGTIDLGGFTQNTSAALSFQGGTIQNGTIIKTGAAYDAQAGLSTAILSGAVGLNKSGAGTFILNAANTYSGVTTLSAGTLGLNNNAALGTSSLTITGGAIDSTVTGVTLNNNALAINGSFSFVGTQNLNMGTGAVSLTGGPTVNVASGSLIIGGKITSASHLTKTGPGTLFLTNSNDNGTGGSSFTGGVTISGGILNVAFLGDNGPSTLGSSDPTMDGGTLQYTGSTNQSEGRWINVTANGGTFDASGTGSMTLAGNIPNAGPAVPFTITITGSSTAANTIGGGNSLRNTNTTGILSLLKTGTGLWIIGNNDSYTGTTTVSNGTLRLSASGAVTSSAITVNGGNLTETIANAITGTASLTVTSGSATLSNANNFTGGATVSGTGALLLSGASAITSNVITANGGTLAFSATNAISGTAAVNINAGSVTFNNSQNTSGVISVANGAGLTVGANISLVNLFFAAPSTFLNVTAVTGQTPLTVSGTLTQNGTTTINIGGAIANAGSYNLIQYTTLAGSNTWALGALPNRVIATIDTATAGLVKLNVSSVDLPRWKGNVAGQVWDINTTANWVLNSDGVTATNYLQPSTPGDNTLFDDTASAFTVNIPATVAPGSVTFNNSANDYIVNGPGAIAGITGIIKTGTSNLTINNANTFTGSVQINGGQITIAADTALGAAPLSATPGKLVLNTSTLSTTATFSLSTNRGIAVGPTTGTGSGKINVAGGTTLTYGGVIANNGGTGALVIDGGGTLVLTGSSTYTGGTTINPATTLQLGKVGTGNGSVTGDILNNGSLVFAYNSAQTFAGAITGSGPVTVAGPTAANNNNLGNYLIFNNTNSTYSGGTFLNSGVLSIGSISELGTAPGSTAVNLTFNGGQLNTTNAIPAAVLNLDATRTVMLNTTGYIRAQNQKAFVILGQITGPGGLGVVLDGGNGGALTLSNSTNNYTGDTTIGATGVDYYTGNNPSAILRMGAANALPYFSNAGFSSPSNLVFGVNPAIPADNTILDLNGFNTQINGLTGGAAAVIDNLFPGTTATLTVGDNNANGNFAGIIRNSATTSASVTSLAKIGTGTLTLTGTSNTYTGATTINAGKIALSAASTNNIATSSVIHLGSAGTLDVTGLTGGNITLGTNQILEGFGNVVGGVIADTATVAPGTIGAIGTLTLGSTLSLTANSTLNFDITGAAKDLLSITGILSVTGAPKITLASSGLSGDYILATFAASGLTNSNFDFSLAPAPSGYVWDVESTFIKLAATAGGPVGGGSGSWNNGNNDGLWDTNLTAGSNWNTAIPNASGHIATFADVAAGGTTPGVVNLVTPKTIGGIVLSSTTTGYTLGTAASPALTLQVPSGSATITVNGTAAHTIAAHTIIASNTTINANSGSLTFSNGIENASSTLSFTGPGAVHSAGITSTGVLTVADAGAHNFGNIAGSPGTPHLVGIVNTIGTAAELSLAGTTSILGNSQVIAASIRQNTLTIGDGTSTSAKLTIPDSSPTFAQNSLVPRGDDSFVSVVKNLTIANSGGFKGTLDLGNNDLIIDYTGGSSPITSIEAMVKSGYNGGNWTGKGITSSTAAQNTGRFALAVIDNNTIATHFNTFDGVDTTSHQQVIVKFSWVADLDLDGVVTSNDAITFAAHYSEGAFANHQTGDLNYNGIFDSNDAIIFAGAYNETLPHLPEPASLGILALGAGALLIKRRK